LEWWLNQDQFLREDIAIATSSLEVGYALDIHNIKYVLMWNYISETEIEKNWLNANENGENWVNYSGVKYSEISSDVAKLAGRDMVMMFQAAMNSKDFFVNFFNGANYIEKVLLFKKEGPALLRTGPYPTNKAADLIEIAVLKFILEDLEISYEVIEYSKKESPEKKSMTHNYKSIKNSALNFFKYKPYAFDKNNKPVVLIYNSLFSREEVLELKGAIHRIGYCAVLISESALNEPRSKGCSYHFCGDSINQEYRYIYHNKYLRYYFDEISSELLYSLNLASSFTEVCKSITPKLVLFGHDAFTRERVISEKCNLMGIETASVMHSGISLDFAMINYCVGSAKNKFLWNDWHNSLLLKHLPYASSINFHTVGSLNHLNYKDKNKSRSKRSAEKKIKVLILTANVNVGASTPCVNSQIHLETLHKIKKQLDTDNYDVIIKSHPSFDNYSIYDSISNECDNFKHSRNENLEKLIEWSDVSVLLNYPTSASIISLLKGCPVIYIHSARYALNLWQCSLLKEKVFYVDDMNHLNQIIEIALAVDELQFNSVCREILGYEGESDLRARLCSVLEDLTSQQSRNRYVISEESLQVPNIKTQMLIYGATGRYFQFPLFHWLGRQAVTNVSAQYYLDGVICNLATRKIPLKEVLSVSANLIMYCLCGPLSLKVFFRVLIVYLMCMVRNFYHQIFSVLAH
jgi:hypothetical protein